MLCGRPGCTYDAVTFHGVTRVVFGHCEEHRCCARCGWWHRDCTCQEGVLERPEYVIWKRAEIEEQKRILDEQSRALRTPPRGSNTV